MLAVGTGLIFLSRYRTYTHMKVVPTVVYLHVLPQSQKQRTARRWAGEG